MGGDDQREREVKIMGQLPPVFDGDRTKSQAFLDLLKAYFRLNHRVPAFQSYFTRIALTLTLIQGPLVEEWARTIGEWLDEQPAQIDNRDTWNQFTAQFTTTFLDTQRDQRARNELEVLKMKWPHIDQYTMDFEKLMREANYRRGTPEAIQMFLKGLPCSVQTDCL